MGHSKRAAWGDGSQHEVSGTRENECSVKLDVDEEDMRDVLGSAPGNWNMRRVHVIKKRT